jgi:heme exporter protein CcmD
MDELIRFFEMGGYARFVWPAYLASAALLGWVTHRALRAEAEALAALRQRAHAREQATR